MLLFAGLLWMWGISGRTLSVGDDGLVGPFGQLLWSEVRSIDVIGPSVIVRLKALKELRVGWRRAVRSEVRIVPGDCLLKSSDVVDFIDRLGVRALGRAQESECAAKSL